MAPVFCQPIVQTEHRVSSAFGTKANDEECRLGRSLKHYPFILSGLYKEKLTPTAP